LLLPPAHFSLVDVLLRNRESQTIAISTTACRLASSSSLLRARLRVECRGMRSGSLGGLPNKGSTATPGAIPLKTGLITPPLPIPTAMATATVTGDLVTGRTAMVIPASGAAVSAYFAPIMDVASPSLAIRFTIPFTILTSRQPCRTHTKPLLSSTAASSNSSTWSDRTAERLLRPLRRFESERTLDGDGVSIISTFPRRTRARRRIVSHHRTGRYRAGDRGMGKSRDEIARWRKRAAL